MLKLKRALFEIEMKARMCVSLKQCGSLIGSSDVSGEAYYHSRECRRYAG